MVQGSRPWQRIGEKVIIIILFAFHNERRNGVNVCCASDVIFAKCEIMRLILSVIFIGIYKSSFESGLVFHIVR